MAGRMTIAVWRPDAYTRVRVGWQPIAHATVAAAIAWLITHLVMGHPRPFFAPIAAAMIAAQISGVIVQTHNNTEMRAWRSS